MMSSTTKTAQERCIRESDRVNVITQFTYKTNMKFHSLGLNTAKITDYIKKLFK